MTSGASGIGLALGFCLCGRRHEVMLAEIEGRSACTSLARGSKVSDAIVADPDSVEEAAQPRFSFSAQGGRGRRRHRPYVARELAMAHRRQSDGRGQLPDAYSCAWRGGHSVNSAPAGIINGMGFRPCAASKLAIVEHALSGICAHQDRHGARNCLARSGRAPALDPKSPAAALVGEIDMRVEVGLIRPMLPRAFLQPPGEPQIAICTPPRLIVALPQSTLPWTMLQADRKCSGRRAVKRLFHGQTDARYRQLPV